MELKSVECIQCNKPIILTRTTVNGGYINCHNCKATIDPKELSLESSKEIPTTNEKNECGVIRLYREKGKLNIFIKEKHRLNFKSTRLLFALTTCLILPTTPLLKILIGTGLVLAYGYAKTIIQTQYRIIIGPLYLTSYRSSVIGNTYNEISRVKTDDIRNIVTQIKRPSSSAVPELELLAQTALQKIVIIPSSHSAQKMTALVDAISRELKI